MNRKMLLFTILSLSLAGSFWALQAAQDPVQPSQTTAAATTQTDLSGTYTGTWRCDAAGLTGDTTLTINGNEFTTSDGKTGRIVASTTGGYTAVALSMPGTDPTAPQTVISMRGNKRGNRLTLTPVSGSTMRCSFTPSRGVARSRRQQTTPAATGTEVANPATEPVTPTTPTTMPTESPMPAQTPSPSPTASPSPAPSPMPTPTPGEPMPSPTPGEPMPSPTPSGSPSPEASPTPSPSPSPRM
ncbi:MAG TPA: hypothetical protein VF290_25750 [Pyrinomonadaceae bacterium]